MPHLGKPSAACKTCKQRHIRCDQTKPSCNRCLKANRVCPGYTEGLDLVLRDQNDIAKASVVRREKSAQKARLATKSPESQTPNESTPADDLSLSLSSSYCSKSSNQLVNHPSYLAPSEDDYQLCLFMGTWVTFPHDARGDRGFVELIPSMYSFAKLDSPLALCVAAISSALSAKFVQKLRDVELPTVRSKFAKALSATRTALDDPVDSLTDETLMAVCLLGFYEEVVESFRGRISSSRHFDGAAALINQRQGQLSTVMAQRLLLGVRKNILQRALTYSTPIDTTSSLWLISGSTTYNAGTLLDQMCIDIPNLLVAASRYQEEVQRVEIDQPTPEHTLSQAKARIITKALAIDAKLSTWPSSIPATWTPLRLSVQNVPNPITKIGGLYQSHCDLYPDIVVSETWNTYRTSRLKVLDVVAQLSSQHRPTTVEMIQELADAICASVPYGMGDRTDPVPLHSMEATYPTSDGRPPSEEQHRAAVALGGWYLFPPMKQVMQVGRWLRPGQLAWMGAQLERLARVYDVDPVDD